MQTGKCILLREFSGIIPINIASTLPTHTELRGFIEGDLEACSHIPYPEPFLSKQLADLLYALRVERAATEISTYLECL